MTPEQLLLDEVQPIVLVVGGSESVRQQIVESLRDAGIEVLETNDGESALELLARHQVQLMIVDVDAPRLDGLQLLDALEERGQLVPAVLLTHDGLVRSLRLTRDVPNTHRGVPPFNAVHLASSVVRVLEEKSNVST